VRGLLSIGSNGFFGDRFTATAEEMIIGDYFYNKPTDSRGMIIGGGGSNFPFAKLKIGNRCVCHTGHINLARPVEIGDDVGLSHDVDLITHGFWYSVLQGFPAVFDGITLGNNVIMGWKSIIMPGVHISDNVVVGANSTVTKDLASGGIYAGSPAKLIRKIEEPTLAQKTDLLIKIVEEFETLMSYYEIDRCHIRATYPIFRINNLTIDLERFSCEGEHDAVSNAFRDFLRRYGIRIYAPQGFVFSLKRKS
jgi:acetyltransferase-like isoleucine patch superfamily enzyme